MKYICMILIISTVSGCAFFVQHPNDIQKIEKVAVETAEIVMDVVESEL